MGKRVKHSLRDGRQRQPNTCTGKSPNQKIVSREKGMKRDIPDIAIILVVQSFLVSEKIKSTGLAMISNLVILIQTELTKGLWEVVVKISWAGQLVVQGIVCLACIEHINNSILPFIGRVIARGLIFLGGRDDKILPMAFDTICNRFTLFHDRIVT